VEKVKWLVGDHQVGGAGREEPGEGRFLEMFALLQLFNSCRSLLDVVAEEILSCGEGRNSVCVWACVYGWEGS